MAYYQQNRDSDAVICDDCGETRWQVHPRYGTNNEARLAERELTGISWAWVPIYSATPSPCIGCNTPTR